MSAFGLSCMMRDNPDAINDVEEIEEVNFPIISKIDSPQKLFTASKPPRKVVRANIQLASKTDLQRRADFARIQAQRDPTQRPSTMADMLSLIHISEPTRPY